MKKKRGERIQRKRKKMEQSMENSKTIQREEKALLGPYDSQKRIKWMTADPYEAGDVELQERQQRKIKIENKTQI